MKKIFLVAIVVAIITLSIVILLRGDNTTTIMIHAHESETIYEISIGDDLESLLSEEGFFTCTPNTTACHID